MPQNLASMHRVVRDGDAVPPQQWLRASTCLDLAAMAVYTCAGNQVTDLAKRVKDIMGKCEMMP